MRCWRCWRFSCSHKISITAATAAIGTLIQNNIGQIVWAMRNAPTSGPTIDPIAQMLER